VGQEKEKGEDGKNTDIMIHDPHAHGKIINEIESKAPMYVNIKFFILL
jgi:hypothetical protein